MNVAFTPQAWEEYLYWQETDPQIVSRIHELLRDIRRNPYNGIGKPEPLKHALRGYWSRRITAEHRIVYKKMSDHILITQLRYHYR
jgi:toxin YoeB